MNKLEAMMRTWNRKPEKITEIKEKLYGVDSLLRQVNAEIKELGFTRSKSREWGWAPDETKVKTFRRSLSEKHFILLMGYYWLKKEQDKLRKQLKEMEKDPE